MYYVYVCFMLCNIFIIHIIFTRLLYSVLKYSYLHARIHLFNSQHWIEISKLNGVWCTESFHRARWFVVVICGYFSIRSTCFFHIYIFLLFFFSFFGAASFTKFTELPIRVAHNKWYRTTSLSQIEKICWFQMSSLFNKTVKFWFCFLHLSVFYFQMVFIVFSCWFWIHGLELN